MSRNDSRRIRCNGEEKMNGGISGFSMSMDAVQFLLGTNAIFDDGSSALKVWHSAKLVIKIVHLRTRYMCIIAEIYLVR